MEKKMETTIMGSIGTNIRIHSFIPSYPKVSFGAWGSYMEGQGDLVRWLIIRITRVTT